MDQVPYTTKVSKKQNKTHSHFTFFSLDLLLLNLIKGRKLDIGQGAREAVKVDKRKIQSSKRDTEPLMGSYTEALSLN